MEDGTWKKNAGREKGIARFFGMIFSLVLETHTSVTIPVTNPSFSLPNW